MRLEDMLKDISGITNKVVKTNCFEGQNTLLDSILLIQTKVNEVIQAINNGIIKGDKGDTPNVQVGVTETLEPNSNASVTQTGDILNPIFNFGIPKGEKGDKGDTGKASESIQDNVTSLDTTWSSTKIDSLFKNIDDTQGLEYITENNFYSINGSKNGVITNIKLEGKTLVVDSNNNVVIPGTQGAMLKSVGDGVDGLKLNSFDGGNIYNGIFTSGYRIGLDGTPTLADGHNITDFLKTYNLGKYYIKGAINGMYIATYNKNNTLITRYNNVDNITTTVDTEYIRLSNPGSLENISISGVQNKTEKIKINTKKVLYKDTDGTWKKPTLRQWDSIEKHSDGKYYYHKRSGNVKITSKNGFETSKPTGFNTTQFWNKNFTVFPNIKKSSRNLICNLISKVGSTTTIDEEFILCGSTAFVISFNDSKANTLDKFETFCTNNKMEIVYELDQEQVFECTPIDLISYDAQTNYSIECGPIYPKSILYINSDYGNVLSNIIRRITQIEEDRIEDRKALIRGDFRLLAEKTYPSDFIKKEVLPNE